MVANLKVAHFVIVIIFFLIYLVKTILLLTDKKEALAAFTKKVKVLEMIVSVLFLVTGVYLMTEVPITPMLIIKITIVFLAIPLAIVGFKKSNKGLATLSFVLITAAFGLGEANKKPHVVITEKAVNTDGTINGKEIYEANCVTCHGKDGKLKISDAFDLSIIQISTDSMTNVILKGRKGMPKYSNSISPEQAKAMAAYIQDNIKGK